jgi:hypothetical protein
MKTPVNPRDDAGLPHATTEDQINEMESEGPGQTAPPPASSPKRSEAPMNPRKTTRKDTHVTKEESPVKPGIDAQNPSSMPRAEDDEFTRAHSPEFHDRPGSGKNIADKERFF